MRVVERKRFSSSHNRINEQEMKLLQHIGRLVLKRQMRSKINTKPIMPQYQTPEGVLWVIFAFRMLTNVVALYFMALQRSVQQLTVAALQ